MLKVMELIKMSNYRLYTTKSCILCQKAKKLIESQQLNVEIVEAQENDIIKFREMNIRSFPVIEIDKKKYIYGVDAAHYIAMNIETLKRK